MKNITLIENPKSIEACDFIQVFSFGDIVSEISQYIEEMQDGFDFHTDSENGLRITLRGNCINAKDYLEEHFGMIVM